MPDFSERLRLLRQNFGLSQQKLADKIGTVSKSSINMYERGAREPNMETMEAFADFFNVDIAYLYGRTDVPNSSVLPPDVHCDAFPLSAHERDLVIAYRAHPDMQPAVDRLLGVEPEASSLSKQA